MTEKLCSDITENLKRVRDGVAEAAVAAGRSPDSVRIMAVTKTVPVQAVNIAIGQGIDLLGENRAQELAGKYDGYNKEGVSIHFIGHLQTNKVRQAVGMTDMVQSVDSVRLAREIDRQAKAAGKVMDVLIEVNAGGENSKSGVPPEDVNALAEELSCLEALRLRGLMTIPPLSDSIAGCETCFECVFKLFIDIRAKNRDNRCVDILSMGMSRDYGAAIKHGANIIRLGSAIFGPRA